MNLLNYVLSPFYWVKVIKLIENGSNMEAYELINKIHQSTVKKNYKYFYFKSYLALVLRQYQESLISIKKGLIIVDSLTVNKINDDERNYLHKYAYRIKNMIYKMTDEYKELEKNSILEKEISYNINNISKTIKDYFPVSSLSRHISLEM